MFDPGSFVVGLCVIPSIILFMWLLGLIGFSSRPVLWKYTVYERTTGKAVARIAAAGAKQALVEAILEGVVPVDGSRDYVARLDRDQ